MSNTRWFDRNGVEIFNGDTIRNVYSNREELVYACHPADSPQMLSLGINASNESFLRLHPGWPREIYPFSQFSFEFKNGKRLLEEYEKVV